MGLGRFVETQTTSGSVGAAIKILGTDLTGATGVTFDGTAATFAVVSPSLITTTVPTGATTGTGKQTADSYGRGWLCAVERQEAWRPSDPNR
jgi:hypothetical protein